MNERDGDYDDTVLVAYLDGELPPDERRKLAQRIAADHDLQRRVIQLSGGNRPFREAFDPLLSLAPHDRLDAVLAGLPDASMPAAPEPAGRRTTSRWLAVAAGILLFLSGLAAGRLAPIAQPPDHTVAEASAEEDWRVAVADYLALYTPATLSAIPDNAAVREAELAAVGSAIGAHLTPAQVDLPGLSLRRTQLLQYDDRPLAQITYLDPEHGPVALCIIADGAANQAMRTEQRSGFNIVFWSSDRRSYMLIGRTPTDRLERLAAGFAARAG